MNSISKNIVTSRYRKMWKPLHTELATHCKNKKWGTNYLLCALCGSYPKTDTPIWVQEYRHSSICDYYFTDSGVHINLVQWVICTPHKNTHGEIQHVEHSAIRRKMLLNVLRQTLMH